MSAPLGESCREEPECPDGYNPSLPGRGIFLGYDQTYPRFGPRARRREASIVKVGWAATCGHFTSVLRV
jgi:hypothetical protein